MRRPVDVPRLAGGLMVNLMRDVMVMGSPIGGRRVVFVARFVVFCALHKDLRVNSCDVAALGVPF